MFRIPFRVIGMTQNAKKCRLRLEGGVRLRRGSAATAPSTSTTQRKNTDMNTNTDMNRKPRPTCANWDEGATVAIRSHGRGWRTERKVVSTGTGELRLPKKYGDSLRRMLRTGLDVHLAFGDEACVRFYACTTKDGKKMVVVAQTMGTFRTDTLAGKKVELRHDGKAMSMAKLLDFATEKLAEIPSRRQDVESVTPDTMVECPKCGYTFRVGRRNDDQ